MVAEDTKAKAQVRKYVNPLMIVNQDYSYVSSKTGQCAQYLQRRFEPGSVYHHYPIILMKINKQIAESLASKVAAQITTAHAKHFSKIENELQNSKEFKKIEALGEKYHELDSQLTQVRSELELAKNKFYDVVATKQDANTNVSCKYHHGKKKMQISVGSIINTRQITDDIIIESAFADSKTSVDDFIDKIVNKYI